MQKFGKFVVELKSYLYMKSNNFFKVRAICSRHVVLKFYMKIILGWFHFFVIISPFAFLHTQFSFYHSKWKLMWLKKFHTAGTQYFVFNFEVFFIKAASFLQDWSTLYLWEGLVLASCYLNFIVIIGNIYVTVLSL